MKKTIFLLLGLLISGVTLCEAHDFRYFNQGKKAASTTPYGHNESVGKYMTVGADSVKIYYEEYGEGKPLLVLHGGSIGSDLELGELIDHLRQEGYHIILPTTRGHGRSYLGTDSLTYDQKAMDMMEVATRISRDPINILGFSDGAYTAYRIADLYPAYVERVVAIGAGTLKAGFYQQNSMSVEKFEGLDAQYMQQWKNVSPEPARIQEFLTRYMEFWNKSNIGEETFGNIHCPVQLIVGEQDQNAPLVTVQEADAMIPNSRLTVIPKASHTCFLDNFKLVWAAVQPFLKADIETLESSKNENVAPKTILFDMSHSQCTDEYKGFETYPYLIPAYQRMMKELGDNVQFVVNEKDELTPELLSKADVVLMLSPLSKNLQKNLSESERRALTQVVAQGKSLIFFIDDAHRVDWQAYGASDVVGPYGISFGEDVPLPGNVGAIAFENKIFSKRYEIPYSGACLMKGGTPVSVCMDGGFLHGTMVELQNGGKLYVGGDTMVGLLLGFADGIRLKTNMMETRWWGKDSWDYMKELLLWGLK